MTVQELRIADIRRDGGTQMRAQLDLATIADYATAMQEGAQFPPVVTFYDGSDYWLADGFQRADAARHIGRETINAEVRAGTRRDAILYAVGANATHGLPRSNADKRRAVESLLRDEEWSAKGNDWVARQCAVSLRTVYNIRAELESALQIAKLDRRKGADGKDYPTSYTKRAEPGIAPAYEPVATWDTMPVDALDGPTPEDELEQRMARIRAEADADMQYDAQEDDAPEPTPFRLPAVTDLAGATNLTRPTSPALQPMAPNALAEQVEQRIEELAAEIPSIQALPVTRFISSLHAMRHITYENMDAWLSTASSYDVKAAADLFARVEALMQTWRVRIKNHQRTPLRVVDSK